MGKQVKGWVPPDEEIIETTEPVAKTEWTPPDDELVEEPVKKKESGGDGGLDFIGQQRKQFEQPAKPSEKSTQKNTSTNKWQAVSDAAKSVDPIVGAAVDLGRKIASGFSDEIPQAIAQGVEVAKSSVNPASNKEFIQRVPVDFQNYVREKEGLKWYQPFEMEKYIDKYADSFMKDTGREDIAKNIEKNRPDIIERRLGVEKYVQKQKDEGAEKMAGATQSYKQIKNLTDLASYIGTLGGNAAYQIPLSVLTKGGSSILQESATVYDQQLDNIAKDKGMTREEVIQKGLDSPAEGQAYAVLAATLDKASAGNILSAFKSGGGQLVKKWVKSAVPEAITEPAQGVLEDVGAGDNIKEALTSSKRIDELAGGLVGGSMGAIGPVSAVDQVRENVIKTDPASLDAAAENIDTALNQNDTESNIANVSQNEKTQEVIDEKENQAQSGADATVESSSEGTAVQPESDSGGFSEVGQEQKIQGDVYGLTPEQRADQELNALVEKGAISRDGNKITILTEEGGREAKRIYGELEKYKVQKANTEGLQRSDESITDGGAGNVSEQPVLSESTGEQRTEPISTDTSSELQSSEPGGSTVADQASPSQKATVQPEQSAGTKTYAIAQRIQDSDADAAIKRGVKEKGSEYVPKNINITDSEAKNLIDLYGEEKSESLVRDTKNELTGDTRTALAARLYENYKRKGDESTSPTDKQRYYDRAVDIALTSAEQLKEAGRQANAAKIWKSITSNEDMTVMAIEKENQRHGQRALSTIYKQVKRSRQQFDEEIQRVIAQRVQAGVEAQLKRAKLITPDKKKKISDAFDALKVKDVGGTANDITRVLGAAVWNGSVEAVKRAVLAGADVANAIQAGIQYIKDNHKGDWDEDQYRATISPAVEQMVEKDKVEAGEIDQSKINTPKLSGKKKKDFLNQVVDAHNANRLTDEKFDQLYAKQLGAKEFTAEERGKIRELARTIAEVERFEDKVKNDFTKENISKYKDLLAKAKKANSDLQVYAQKPSNIWDTLISMMQGGLLTSLSLVTNIYSNTALQPLRFMSTGIGSLVDYSISQLAKTSLLNDSYRDTTIDLLELQKGYFSGAWNGTIEGLKQLKTGPMADERSLREINNSFSPVRAITRWSDSNRSAGQKANDYIEGTLGWHAEAMFRLLNAGDKPFRRAAETARAMEIAKKKGLKGNDLEKFLMFPDAESADAIQKAGNEATFQQDNASAKFIQDMLSKLMDTIGKTPIIGGPLKVLAKSQIPYVKTPWNIMVETLKYAAFPVTGAVGIHQISKGNKRSGSVLIGQAMVGAMVFAVAKELFSMGLLSWDEPYDQKSGKQRERRQMQYDNIPPNALNVSAIQRGLLDGDWSVKDNDTWIDYTKLGVVGLLFDNYSNNYFANIREDQQMPEDSEFYVDMLTTAPRVLSQSLDQSFLKGTNAFLTALQDGGGYETEQWLISTSGALAAIVYPNTLSTISKSSDEFIRDTRDDSFAEKLKNTYKTKFFIGEQLPPKVNLWGEKVTGNPEGRDKYAYYLWDPTKFKNVDTDSWKYKLYQSWKESKFDDDYLPSIPKREITYRKVKIKLDGEQYQQLATAIGEQRKNLASTYINSAGFDRKDKEKVIKKLKDLYEEGADRGKKQFLRDMGWNVMTPAKLSQIGKKQ